MATIKKAVRKTIKKAQFGCGPGGCMKSAEGMTRREYREMKRTDRQIDRENGDRPMQKLLKGVGISTQEGIERRQARKSEKRAGREERRVQRGIKREERKAAREDRRANTPDMPAFKFAFKQGGKIKKAQSGKTLKTQFTMSPNPKHGMRTLEMDTTGYSQGAKRFPVTETTPGYKGKTNVGKFATNRKGAESMIERTQGKSNKVTLPIRRAKSVAKKNPYIKSQKTGGKTSKRK